MNNRAILGQNVCHAVTLCECVCAKREREKVVAMVVLRNQAVTLVRAKRLERRRIHIIYYYFMFVVLEI